MAERVIRMMSAEERYPTAAAGTMNCHRFARRSSSGETYVIGGIHPSWRTKSRITTMPSQNDGIDRPASDTTRSA